MAAPIIDAITAVPATVPPGGAFVVTIAAHDPDNRAGTLTGSVTDSTGNVAQASALVTIGDVLSYALADANAVGFRITPRAGQPGVFDCVAP